MSRGTVGILNVGAGDTKLSFDPSKPEEMKRAAEIVDDMIRRGFAIFVEVERDGEKIHRRVRKFRKDNGRGFRRHPVAPIRDRLNRHRDLEALEFRHG